MNYIETIFWIASAYDETHGWPDKETEYTYYQELKELLASVQWEVLPFRAEKIYPILLRGKECLELTPQYLHGIIAQDSAKGIGKILLQAKGFQYQKIEMIAHAVEMSGSEYLLKLRARQEEMAEDVLKICEKAMSGEYLTSEAIYEKIEKKYHIPRVGEYEEDVILKGVFKNMLSILTGKQLLSEGTAENEQRFHIRTNFFDFVGQARFTLYTI